MALQRQLGPWKSLASYPPYHKAQDTYVINTTEADLSSDIKLKNIFGYNLAKSDDGYDYDGSPYHFFETQGTLTAGSEREAIAQLDAKGLFPVRVQAAKTATASRWGRRSGCCQPS